MTRLTRLSALAVLLASGSASPAGFIYRFDTGPFAGSTVLQTPGRQFVGNELFIPAFAADDVFSFDAQAFGVTAPARFFSGPAADLPAGGFNVIVLQDSDDDNNPQTPFNAGASANLIASVIDTPGAGFFVYFNSVLGVNRLVYSTDLSAPTADLKILARIQSPTGQGAIDALPGFTPSNFEVTAVPGPTSVVLLAAGSLITLPVAARRARPAAWL